MPPGCDVTYELEALNIMRALLRPAAPDALKDFYQDFRDRNGQRRTAIEVFHERYSPRSAQHAYGSWLGYVAAMGDMEPGVQRAYEESQSFLDALEVTAMTKSYKMVVLLALLETPLCRNTSTMAQVQNPRSSWIDQVSRTGGHPRLLLGHLRGGTFRLPRGGQTGAEPGTRPPGGSRNVMPQIGSALEKPCATGNYPG